MSKYPRPTFAESLSEYWARVGAVREGERTEATAAWRGGLDETWCEWRAAHDARCDCGDTLRCAGPSAAFGGDGREVTS